MIHNFIQISLRYTTKNEFPKGAELICCTLKIDFRALWPKMAMSYRDC